jgi:hypothetical protein
MSDDADMIGQFSKHLFWDVDRTTVDVQEHKSWLIARVLEYGEMKDWKTLLAVYSLSEIVKSAQNVRSLDSKTVSFLCVVGQVAKESFRCYMLRQLKPTLWNS